MSKTYQTSDIKVLPAVEHIRRRPKMYLGSTDRRAIIFLAKEMANQINGNAIFTGDGFTVHGTLDIPDEDHPKLKKSYVEVLCTQLACGGDDNYACVVACALSSKMTVRVNSKEFEFSKGILQDVRKINQTNGIVITFTPDKTIFQTCNQE